MAEDDLDQLDSDLSAKANGEADPLLDEGGKKSKTLLMIGGLVVLVLIGGGIGAYFTGALDGLLGKETTQEDTADATPKGGQAQGGGVFLPIPDMIVNLSSNDATPRYLRLSVQLELSNEADRLKVETVMPRVVDQFQTYLRELRVADLRGSAGIYRLQMELLTRVNEAAHPVVVQDVLFQEILIQ